MDALVDKAIRLPGPLLPPFMSVPATRRLCDSGTTSVSEADFPMKFFSRTLRFVPSALAGDSRMRFGLLVGNGAVKGLDFCDPRAKVSSADYDAHTPRQISGL